MLATRGPSPPGQEGDALHTTAPGPVGWSGLLLGKRALAPSSAAHCSRRAGTDHGAGLARARAGPTRTAAAV